MDQPTQELHLGNVAAHELLPAGAPNPRRLRSRIHARLSHKPNRLYGFDNTRFC
jgi:hypothetical protein